MNNERKSKRKAIDRYQMFKLVFAAKMQIKKAFNILVECSDSIELS